MTKPRILVLFVPAVIAAAFLASTGCVNVKTPDEINIGGVRRTPVDASHVPPTATHDECREKLTEAYGEIQRLQNKVGDLERDKRELKADREECEKKYKKLKERYKD